MRKLLFAIAMAIMPFNAAAETVRLDAAGSLRAALVDITREFKAKTSAKTSAGSNVNRRSVLPTGIALSTHDPDHAFSMADRVALMRAGEIISSGVPSEVVTADRLRTVYGGEMAIERLTGGQAVCASLLR